MADCWDLDDEVRAEVKLREFLRNMAEIINSDNSCNNRIQFCINDLVADAKVSLDMTIPELNALYTRFQRLYYPPKTEIHLYVQGDLNVTGDLLTNQAKKISK